MQRQIVERVVVERAEIAREHETADRIASDINAEIEELVLVTRKLKKLHILEDRK